MTISTKPYLLIVAHGSRRQASNEEIEQLSHRVASGQTQFAGVSCGFLELAEPSIPEALLTLIHAGARQIVVMPYFLSAGRHVSEDIPGLIAPVSDSYPNVEITLADYLGASEAIPDILLKQAIKQLL